MSPHHGRRVSGRRAAATVETALVLGLFFTSTLGLFEYGRMLMMRNLMQNAVREGGRQAVVGTSTNTTGTIQATVIGYLAGQQFSNLTVQVYAADAAGNKIAGKNWNDAAFGESIAVQADADYAAMLPSFGVLPQTVHITAKSVMQSEAN